ncbi:hypothetical protein H6P81_011015 [Aristolochia fimbriata]|uniref:Uncharacterized protein n=1 Tax=Aristolochia fimbriata TaxID=158543 RepID=A0AAV7EQD8_ARIFI|nr:hypothetical protein H6P81_011015 [Aristolochia fimbriata]
MRGVGGPLLCIGDLLADVGDAKEDHQTSLPQSQATSNQSEPVSPSQLHHLFEENYYELKKALTGMEPSDHSWTALTLKLCSALETADKLVQSATMNVEELSEKIGLLETILKRGDLAVESARSIICTKK